MNENQTEMTTEIKKSEYAGMSEIGRITNNIISQMQDGQRIGREDFFKKILEAAEPLNMTKSTIISLSTMYIKSSKEATIERGRIGGIYKGNKPQKIDPRPKCKTCNQYIRNNAKFKPSEHDLY